MLPTLITWPAVIQKLAGGAGMSMSMSMSMSDFYRQIVFCIASLVN